MDDRLSLEVEWPMDIPKLDRESVQAKKIITGVGDTAEEVSDRVRKRMGAVFSDSAAEIEAYKKSLKGLDELKPPADPLGLDELKSKLADVQKAKADFTAMYEAGKMGAKEYEFALASLARTEKQLMGGLTGGDAPGQPGATPLTEQERLLRSIREEYRGVLVEGTAVFQALSPGQQKIALQLIRQKEELSFVHAAQKEVNEAFAQGTITARQHETAIAGLTAKEKALRVEIEKTSKSGTQGFEEMGKSVKKGNGLLSTAWGWLRRISYLIPGLGLAGLFGLALEPLMKWVRELGEGDKALRAINKSLQEGASAAAKQIAETKLLVDRINDHNTSLQVRQRLLNDFVSSSPTVLGALNLQNIATAEGKLILDGYIESLREKMKLESLERGYAASVQRETDLRTGALSDETDFKWYNNLARHLGRILTFTKTYDETLEEIDDINQQRRDKAADEQAVITKNYEDRIKAEVEGRGRLVDAQDSSLKALEQSLSSVNNRLMTLQEGESDAALKAEKASLEKRIAERRKQLGLETKQAVSAANQIVNQQRALRDRLAAVEAEYSRKSKTSDEEEVQALRDKFAKIREEIERFNAKSKSGQIDLAGLGTIEERAVNSLRYRQDTAKLQAELQQQADLWQQYEDFKTATSKEHADERYADELSKIRSFRGELEKQVSALAMKSITDGLTGGEEERLKALDTLLRAVEDKELADRDRRFKDAYNATLTYEKQRQKIIADSEAKITALKDNAAKDQARKARDQALLELDVEYLKSMDTIKSVFEDVDEMSTAAGRKALVAARDTFEAFINEGGKTGRHIEALRKIFNKLFDDVDKGLADRGVEGWRTISAELSTIAGTIAQIDEGTGQWLDSLANVIGNVAKVKAGLKEMKDAQASGDTIQGVTSFMGVYGAILGTVGGIFSKIIDGMVARREAEWAYRQEQQQKQAQALNKVLEYQLSLINDLYGVNRLDRYREVIDEINRAQSDLAETIQGRIINVGDQYVDKLIADINSGKTSIAELERSVQSLRHQADAMAPQSASDFGNQNALYANARKIEQAIERIRAGVVLTGSESIEDLKKLYGQLDAGTIEQIERLDELKQKYKEVFNQLREEITGTSFSALLDSSLSIFRDGGVDAGDAWAKGFDKMVEDYMVQKFSRDYLAEKMQAWYDEFANMAEDGLTESEKDVLRAERDRIWKEGNQVLDDLRDTLGVEKPMGSGVDKGISGRINRTIEESTASEILGFERARYDLHKRTLGNAEETLRVEKQMYDALLQSIRHQAAIEQNTADTVTELRTAVVELKAINKNTKQTSTSYDRP